MARSMWLSAEMRAVREGAMLAVSVNAGLGAQGYRLGC